MTTENKRDFLIKTAYALTVAALIYFGCKYAFKWFSPFIIGFAAAVLLQAPVNKIYRKTHLPRGGVSVVLVIIFLGTLGLVLWRIGCAAVDGVNELSRLTPTLVAEIPNITNRINVALSGASAYLPAEIDGRVRFSLSVLSESLRQLLTTLSARLANWVIGAALPAIPSVIFSFIMTVIVCCFICLQYDQIVLFLKRQLPVRWVQLLTGAKNILLKNTLKMIKAYALIMLITFAQLAVGLGLLRIPNFVTVAALISVVDIMPVLGVGTVMIPWGMIELLLGRPSLGLGILILYSIISMVRNIIEPKIVGRQMGLPPIVALISMYAGFRLFGIIGMLLTPLIVLIFITFKRSGELKIWK